MLVWNNTGKFARHTRKKWEIKIIIHILFTFLSQGSVIASLNVSYSAVDSLQIVFLQEEIAGGRLGYTPAQLLNVTTSNYGKCNQRKSSDLIVLLLLLLFFSFLPEISGL